MHIESREYRREEAGLIKSLINQLLGGKNSIAYEDEEHIYLLLPSLHHLVAMLLNGMPTFFPCAGNLVLSEWACDGDLRWDTSCTIRRLIMVERKKLLYATVSLIASSHTHHDSPLTI